MSTPLAPVTLTAGASVTVNVGAQGTVGAVVIGNESPYALQASAGSGGIWVYGQMADRLNCDTSAFGGNITLRSQDYLTNSSVAPSFVVFLTVYAPGEPIPGTYPCALSRMFNLGNTVNTNAQTPDSLEQDIVTPFVLTGLTAAKDGSAANRLDVAGGVALVRQSDQSIGRVAPSATNFTTVQINSTYYLDLNPDGSWSFATAHSSQPNYLAIAQVTTDASGNIVTVTDQRTLNTTLFSAMSTTGVVVALMAGLQIAGQGNANGPSTNAQIGLIPGAGTGTGVLQYWLPSDAFGGGFHEFITYRSGVAGVPLGVGDAAIGNAANPSTIIDQAGVVRQVAGQATAGSFGMPLIVAQTVDQHITATGTTTLLTFTAPVAGLYRASLYVLAGGANPSTLTAEASFTDRNGGLQQQYFSVQSPTSGGVNPVSLNSVSVPTPNCIAAYPIMGYVKAGGICQINYRNVTATPNDYASAMIERLS